MKKILVTGATGFIGSYVINKLLHKGYRVVATSSNISKAKTFNWFESVEYVELDFNIIKSSVNYYEYFKFPTSLIHLAWEGLPNYKNDFHLTENLPKHQLLLSNLIVNGLRDITAIGTCFEYGMQEGMLSETMECKPDNAYAKAKNELRIFLEKIAATSSINFKWVRLFYMYGKGQSTKSLISQLDAALENNDTIFNMSGGEQIRDFLPIEKVAENIATIALQNQIEGLINCCSGEPITVKQFVENYLVAKQKTIKLNLGYYPYPDFEPMKFWGDTNKINKILKP